jgi:hypothetical protein
MAMTPEARVKEKVKKLLKARGAWFYMPVQNGMGKVGIPDFIGTYKGLFFAIETKAPNKTPTSEEQRWNKATPNQQMRIEEIREAGGMAIVCDDVEQAEHMLDVLDAIRVFRGEE